MAYIVGDVACKVDGLSVVDCADELRDDEGTRAGDDTCCDRRSVDASRDVRSARTSFSLRSEPRTYMAAGFQSAESYRRSSSRGVAAGCPASGASVASAYARAEGTKTSSMNCSPLLVAKKGVSTCSVKQSMRARFAGERSINVKRCPKNASGLSVASELMASSHRAA